MVQEKKERMKIGFEAVSIFGVSGIEMYTRSLIRALSELENGPDIHLFTSSSRQKRVAEYFRDTNNIKVKKLFLHPLALGKIGAPLIKFIKNDILMKKASAEVDLFHNVNPCFYHKNIKNMAVTVHDLFVFYDDDWAKTAFEPDQQEFQENFLSAFENAKVVFTPTRFVADEILTKFPWVDKKKIYVTYEAANEKFRKAEPDFDLLAQNGIKPDMKYFLFVSRIDPRKNYERILEAYSKLPEKIKQTHKFVFVGGAKDHIQKKLYELTAKLGIADNFIHLDNISNEVLVQVYNRATALIFATFAEGFGLPIVEAMNCGCPVITSNVSCMPEIAGNAALLVNPYSTEEIVTAMQKTAKDEDFRNDLIQKGFRRGQEFSWHKTALETYMGYIEIAED